MRFTLDNVPPSLDQALREKARAEGRSVNDVALALLAKGLEGPATAGHDDLDWFLGTGGLEPQVLQAMEALDTPDPEDWK